MATAEVLFGLGAVALLVVLIWARVHSKRRNRANDLLTEAATRAEYDNPDAYTTEQERYRDQIRPS